MGLVQLNGERDRTLGGPIWELLAFTSLIFAWSVVPREPGLRRSLLIVLKSLGVVGLIVLLAIFRGEPQPVDMPFWGHVDEWVWLRTEWWGILGLIGWAYLTTAILWLILGHRREWLMGALATLILVHLAMQRGGLLTRLDGKPWLGVVSTRFQDAGTGDRSDRSVCRSRRRHRLARGDLDGRLPARIDPATRQRRDSTPRPAPLGVHVCHWAVAGRPGHRYLRGHQQDRCNAHMVLVVGGHDMPGHGLLFTR